MPEWLSLNLGDAMLGQPRLAELEAYLSGVYEQAGRPPDWVAGYRHENNGMHCYLVVLMTTGFQARAGLEGTVPCDKPWLADVSFLAGHRRCLEEGQ